MGNYDWVIDVILFFFMAGLTWAISSEGLWGAALMFVNVMFAGLVAFSHYEYFAGLIDRNVDFMASYSDFVSLVVLFTVTFTLLRLATDNLAPTMVRFPGWLYQVGRFVFGGATAWYMAAMVLCMLQTAPIHKQFLYYQWKTHAFWSWGIDRFWLGYVQTTTDRIFDWDPSWKFDARSDFILRYHNHREFGVPDPEIIRATGAGAAQRPAGTSGGATAPSGPAGQILKGKEERDKEQKKSQ